jgi:hypothetical protein
VAHWDAYRGAVISKQSRFTISDDESLPSQFFFCPRFTFVDSSPVWMLIKVYINQLCGETPTNFRMGVSASTTKFVGLSVNIIETRRNAAINSTCQSHQDTCVLEGWLEMQPQCFAMHGINADSYNVAVWVTSHLSKTLNNWWLNRKQLVAIPNSFDSLVAEIRRTFMLPNILNDAMSAMLGLTQGFTSYTNYTQVLNVLSRWNVPGAAYR